MQSLTKRDMSQASSTISTHCSTIERKGDRLSMAEFVGILNDFVRLLSKKKLRSNTFIDTMNQVMHTLISSPPSALRTVAPHDFFVFVRDNIQEFLQKTLRTNDHFHEEELHLFRNNVRFMERFVESSTNLADHRSWLTDRSFVQTFAKSLDQVKRVIKLDPTERLLKQIVRLLNIFTELQTRVPSSNQKGALAPLFEPVVRCLMSRSYWKTFQSLQSGSSTLSTNEKFFLVRCPHFFTSYHGSALQKSSKDMLDQMLPRYAEIFDQHMKSIKSWRRPVMRAIHNLLNILIHAEDSFLEHASTRSFQALINHFLRLIDQRTILEKIRSNSNNMESLIIDAVVIILTTLVFDADALDYIRRRKPTELFRQLTFAPRQSIVLNAYMLMAYTIDEEGIKNSSGDFGQLIQNIADVLNKNIAIRDRLNRNDRQNLEAVDRNIMQLIETLKGLIQHDSLKLTLYQAKVLPQLIDCYHRLQGFSKQILLDAFWTLAFNEKIAKQLRHDIRFISSVERLADDVPRIQQQRPRLPHASSMQSLRSDQIDLLNQGADYRLKALAVGLLWTLMKEQAYESLPTDKSSFRYHVMISSCYADRKIVDKIHLHLVNRGFRVWFDQEDLNEEGEFQTMMNTFESTVHPTIDQLPEIMAASSLILVCISDAFKRDNGCRTLVQYAAHHKRRMLPIIVRSGSKPDGWLASTIDTKTCFKLTTSNLNATLDLLAKEIEKRTERGNFATSPGTVNQEFHFKSRTPLISMASNVTENRNTQSWEIPNEEHNVTLSRSSTTVQSIPETLVNSERPRSITPGRSLVHLQDNHSSVSRQSPATIQQGSKRTTPMRSVSSPHKDRLLSISEIHEELNNVTVVAAQSPIPKQDVNSPVFVEESKELRSEETASIPNAAVTRETTSPAATEKQDQPDIHRPKFRSGSASTVTSDVTITSERPANNATMRVTSTQTVIGNKPYEPQTPVASLAQYQSTQVFTTNGQPTIPVVSPVTSPSLPSATVNPPSSEVPIVGPVRPPPQNLPAPTAGLLATSSQNQPSTSIASSRPESATNNRSIFRSPASYTNSSNGSYSSEETDSYEDYSTISVKPTPKAMPSVTQPIASYPPMPQTRPIQPEPPKISMQFPNPSPMAVGVTGQRPPIMVPPPIVTLRQGPTAPVLVDRRPEQKPIPSVPANNARTTGERIAEKSHQQQVEIETVSESESESLKGSILSSSERNNSTSSAPEKAANTNTLPTVYTNRHTNQGHYRTITMNAWTTGDVLDFLFDQKLYAMMPLCELMSGPAFLRLYQMCLENSTAIYNQLNQELQARFNGLSLPIAVYNQYLAQTSSLINPPRTPTTPSSPARPKIVERVVLMTNQATKQPASVTEQ